MCGIVAILRRRSTREAPAPRTVEALVEAAEAALREATSHRLEHDGLSRRLADVATNLSETNRLLSGVPGLALMLQSCSTTTALQRASATLGTSVSEIERRLDTDTRIDGARLERLNQALLAVRDGVWSLERDRLRASSAVAEILSSVGLGTRVTESAMEAYLSVHQALSAVDRLEVRGRDSAGLHLLIRNHGLDLDDPSVLADLANRSQDPTFGSGSVRLADGVLSIVYKTAREIGELGDNTAALRDAIASDRLLAAAVNSAAASTVVLGHTRWASVGIISEANTHPLNSDLANSAGPYVVAALNGDVDNYADLLEEASAQVHPLITTDSKTVPVLTSMGVSSGLSMEESFRRAVSSCEGSVAIAACTTQFPEQLRLALRGSGQSLYVGFAEDAFVVASEPYGVVEETPNYLRMDGETAHSANPNGRGQIITLNAEGAGTLAGLHRSAYDGTPLLVSDAEVLTASITTRDIDRADHPHYLLKEIGQAPASFRKTLRGRIVDTSGSPELNIGPETMPHAVRVGLRSGALSRVIAIGQGTAAIAAQSFAAFLQLLLQDSGADRSLRSVAMPATELSAFHLRPDMSDTLVVAVSQSGTTTDTNRTVDLARARGAQVVAIVNRRYSDLVERADGVFYTADGRDVEMSVASTKAFYSQIAAGCLLAIAVTQEASGGGRLAGYADLLESLRQLPSVLEKVLATQHSIGEAARRHVLSRRYWAVVGNGMNRIAASELRIKLSELCYKSISSDTTEDKKHIDLSAEPLILVCAAGLSGSVADDVAKEIAIFSAHRACAVVIVSEGETRFDAAADVLRVPAGDPRLAFLPATMVGHLFGYEAALAIDASALPLRSARAAIETAAASPGATAETVLVEARPAVRAASSEFLERLRQQDYDGTLEASTAVRLTSLLPYATGLAPLDSYEVERGSVGSPATLLADLSSALSRAIDELTRPIDAIRHQAKTVTVGISRSDQALLDTPLTQAVLAAGAPRDHLAYSTLRTLVALAPAVMEVLGHTRYHVEGFESVAVTGQSGIATDLVSRTITSPALTGTKRRVATERTVLVSRGLYDGRTVVIVPEVAAGATVGITLLHVRFAEHLGAQVASGVLRGYRNRYRQLRDAVTETEPDFDETLLASVDVVDILTQPVLDLAIRWRSSAEAL